MNGIVKDLPDADYRAAEGYGSTSIKWFLTEAPAQAKHWIDYPRDAPTFDAAYVGQLIHALVLGQPHPFVVKTWDGRTKDGKARADEVAAQRLVPLSEADFRMATGCSEGVLRHPGARAILEQPGSAECSVFATVDGIKAKARFDWLPDKTNGPRIAIDLKSAASANPDVFTRNAANFEYAVQRAHYLDVLRNTTGADDDADLQFIVIDKRPPHLVSLVGLPDIWKQIGHDKAARARRIIRECEETGVWPDYGQNVHYIEPPSYYVYASEEHVPEMEIA